MASPEMAGVEAVLAKSRALGFLGPGAIGPQVSHAAAFVEAAAEALPSSPANVIDLGSGGGLPGLVLAVLWPETPLLLVDGSVRRCSFLEEAIVDLGVSDHVTVRCGRAEDLGQEPQLRASTELVVARSLGAPPVLAECAAGLLVAGGHLLVSEPPENIDDQRWPTAGLAMLGMGPVRRVVTSARFALIEQVEPCPERFPRRVGIPAKRPLF